jgi:PadR family transcriptional regulator, regulatory protein PadR
MTVAVATVLRVFLEDVGRARYGYELMRLTVSRAGSCIRRWRGWSGRELADPAVVGRPVRRLYRISDEGIRGAGYQLAALSEEVCGRLERRGPHVVARTPIGSFLLVAGRW